MVEDKTPSKAKEKKPESVHAQHRSRLKARFLKEDIDSFEPHNALELALFYSIPVKDTNELAHRLIAHFGSFSAVLEADYHELCKVKGVGAHVATFLKLIPSLGRYYANDVNRKTVVMTDDEQIAELLRPNFIGRTKELFFLMTLDNKGAVLSADALFEGGINSVAIHVRDIIETVVRTKAVSVIVAHNHPRGIAVPSNEDMAATQMIGNALKSIHVKLLDHFIFAGADYTSMRASRFLE